MLKHWTIVALVPLWWLAGCGHSPLARARPIIEPTFSAVRQAPDPAEALAAVDTRAIPLPSHND